MKKITTLLFVLAFMVFSLHPIEADSIDLSNLNLSSQDYILYNLEHDQILTSKNADEKISPASLTKMMSVIVTLEQLNITSIDAAKKKMITIDYRALDGLIAQDASVAGFSASETVTLDDLLHGALLPSGADATQAMAYAVSGDLTPFIDLMNQKAAALGMTSTHFTNTHGLDDEQHYSTVRDLLTLLRYGYQNAIFKEIIGETTYTSSSSDQHPSGITMTSTLLRYITKDTSNSNLLYDPYIYGGKTGSTDNAGLCLASVAFYNNLTYFFVSAKAPETTPAKAWHILDADKVYTDLYGNYQYATLLTKNQVYQTIKINSGAHNYEVSVSQDVLQLLPNSVDASKLTITVTPAQSTFTAPIEIGTKMATLEIKNGDTLIYTQDFTTTEKIDRSLLAKILDFLKVFVIILLALVLLAVLIIVILRTINRRRQRRLRKQRYRYR